MIDDPSSADLEVTGGLGNPWAATSLLAASSWLVQDLRLGFLSSAWLRCHGKA